MSDQAHATADRSPAPDAPASQPQVAPAQEFAAPQAEGNVAAALRLFAGGGQDGVPSPRRFPAAQQHQALLALQRTVGNRAVNRQLGGGSTGIVQRDPPPAGVPATGQVQVRLAGRIYAGTPEQMETSVRRRIVRLLAQTEAAADAHFDYRTRIHDWAGSVADWAGGTEMPPLEIWQPARNALGRASDALGARDWHRVGTELTAAIAAYEQARWRWNRYVGDSTAGAQRAVTTLEGVAVVGAIAATVATGGAAAAAGAGLLATSTAVGAVAGAYGATQVAAAQGSEIHYGLREEFDAAAILRRGLTDAVMGFVGGMAGGALTQGFARVFGAALSRASPRALELLGRAAGRPGPLPLAYFESESGGRAVAEFLGGVGSAPLEAATRRVLARYTGQNARPFVLREFLCEVALDMIQGGALQLFIGALRRGRGLRAPGERTAIVPPEPPAGGVRPRAGSIRGAAEEAPRGAAGAEARAAEARVPMSGPRHAVPVPATGGGTAAPRVGGAGSPAPAGGAGSGGPTPTTAPRLFTRFFMFGRRIPVGTVVEATNMRDARRWYRNWARRSPGREVEIRVHRPTGRIFVQQGGPGYNQSAGELGTRIGVNGDTLDSVAHFHNPYARTHELGSNPIANTDLIQMPSGSDLSVFLETARRTGQAFRSRIHYRLPNGRWGMTDIVVDPARMPPFGFWIRRGPNRGVRGGFETPWDGQAVFNDIANGVAGTWGGVVRPFIPQMPPRPPRL
jgi:hypothetical protein